MTVKIILAILALSLSAMILSCDGMFPTQTKSRPPADHTDIRGGFFHKGDRHDGVEDCKSCHGINLTGGVGVVEEIPQLTPSCYQCHGDVWTKFE